MLLIMLEIQSLVTVSAVDNYDRHRTRGILKIFTKYQTREYGPST